MRLVLIIQSLIILAGAYYVYTLTRPQSDTKSADEPNVNIEVRRVDEGETNSAQAEVEQSTDNNEVMIGEGHNDLGMEFPTPDEGNLEVR